MPVATQKEQESSTHPEKKKRQPVYFKDAFSSPRNFARYVAYKFSADQWFGTFFMLGVIYWNALSIREGKSRQATAKGTDRSDLSAVKTKKNWPQIVGGFVFNCSNIWTLFSDRKAKPPEGRNQLERMWNAIRHPNESQLQTVHAIGLPFMLGIIFNHIRYGFFDGEEEERFSRRVLAVTSTINILMTQSVMFGKRAEKNTSKETIKSAENPKVNSNLPYPLRVLQMAWRENKQQIFSATTGLIGALTLLTEGRMKRRSMLDRLEKATTVGSPQWHNMRTTLVEQFGALSTQETLDKINGMRASKLAESSTQIKKGIAGIIITMMSAFYQMDQLLKGQKKASAEPSGEPESKPEEPLIIQHAEDRAPHLWRDRVTQHSNAGRTIKPEQPLLPGRNMANSPRSVTAIASGESLAVAQETQR